MQYTMLMVTKAKQVKKTQTAKKPVAKKTASVSRAKKAPVVDANYQPGKVSFLVAALAAVSLTLLGIIAVNGA